MQDGGAPELADGALVLERMDEAFYAVDAALRFTLINARAEAFWGMKRAQMVGRSMLELFPRFRDSQPHAAHEEALRTQQPVTIETISTATGAPVQLRIFPHPGGLSVYFRDISDRRAMQLELSTREELLSLAEQSAGIGVWVQDMRTEMLTATPQFFTLLGVEPVSGPVAQDFVRSFRHPDDRERVTRDFREAMARGADSFESEYRIIRPSGEERWIFGRGMVQREGSGEPNRYAGVDIDITERKKQEAHLHLVMNELQHRTNNLLAVVQGLAQQTLRGSATIEEFSPTFSARLQGLSHSTRLLVRDDWRGAPLGELIRAQVSPFAAMERFELDGPDVRLSPKAVQNLGLAFHELCTNAMKYGALSVPEGRVSVRWHIDDGGLHCSWTEHDGPAVSAPTRKGFGRIVSEQVINSALGGVVETEFAPSGLVWRLTLPADQLA